MEGLEELQRDPFLVTCNFSDEKGSFSDVSAIELAFKSNKSERVLRIIEVTEGWFAIIVKCDIINNYMYKVRDILLCISNQLMLNYRF